MAKRKKTPALDESASASENHNQHSTTRTTEPIRYGIAFETSAGQIEDSVVLVEQTVSEMENRQEPRMALKVATVVQFKDGDAESWKEMTEVTTVSRIGAALVVSRQVPVGRIVSLVMQMPRELRVYDLDEQVYPILGIVQNCTSAELNDRTIYHIGVAFIGKRIPAATKSNSQQCYRIVGLGEDGLWKAVAAANTFQSRKYSRFWSRFEVTVSLRDSINQITRKERVMTRDVSCGGMSVFGPLDAKVGERVKISTKDFDFYSMAVVRNRTENEEDENKSLIHFEFDGAEFPVEKVHFPAPETTSVEVGETDSEQLTAEDSGGEIVRF